jgi:hypothetical protein
LDGPAFKVGIQPGDTLLGVNRSPVAPPDGVDLSATVPIMFAAVQGNRLIVEEWGLILRRDVVHEFQNIEFRGRGSEDALSFGKQQRTERFQVGGGDGFHDTGSECRTRAKPVRRIEAPTSD